MPAFINGIELDNAAVEGYMTCDCLGSQQDQQEGITTRLQSTCKVSILRRNLTNFLACGSDGLTWSPTLETQLRLVIIVLDGFRWISNSSAFAPIKNGLKETPTLRAAIGLREELVPIFVRRQIKGMLGLAAFDLRQRTPFN
ncbi:hypothetical protein PAAG_11334 [Paracoccidioides lutzii Pb01]|uniref:Uncharacterized protein n=1 Tax=Paracoccidioides lutzii (strain ATCC MYA-826 / Pb01) TaxID=502779 RepID=A0A0A2V369_PARBA|nr:hypothetical protein PAAG_11334 [Paracoccidioides lutzii Pb01]KGQ01943.1 hypothetical protein PAAG_11334 [Paracoccidioides lutzii Pb01]